MSSVYPTSVITFTTKTNEVDDVDAAHVNTLQDEVIALQQYVGTNPHGSMNNLADRLNVMISGSGAINGGTGFPAQTTPMRLFYRTDSETLYIRRADNTAEQAIGGAPTNVLFCWTGIDDLDANGGTGHGLYNGLLLTPTCTAVSTVPINYNFLVVGSSSTGVNINVLESQFKKISGISTVQLYAKIWGAKANTTNPRCQISLNSGAITSTTNTITLTSPTWASTPTIDVSALENGTVYNLQIGLISGTSSEQYLKYLSKCIVFGA